MNLTVWQRPTRFSGYVMGVDTAEGLGHGDFSCVQVLDVKTGEQVAVWHGRIPPDELATEVFRLGLWYGDALCCVEANNHGLTTITQLRQLGYPNLFRKRSLNQVDQRVSQEYGWKTTKTSKPLMIDDLGMALKNYELKLYCEHTLAELRTFTRNERGQMSGSPFDDRVMALALANQMRKYAYVPEYREEVDDTFTFDWWVRQIPTYQDSSPNVIGKHLGRGTA
tara:strand:- start:910 stop:1581 length:672 start_codon:yes stop_codon:yes gene_type:complete